MPRMQDRKGSRYVIAVALLGVIGLTGCQDTIPKEALQLTQESLEQRQIQTRRFDTNDEATILSASAAVLQDLGFTLDESETNLGLIVASKNRGAVEAQQVVAAILISALSAAAGGSSAAMPWDDNQKIRVSLVTHIVGEENKSTRVRITFQRLVWDTYGQLSKAESLTDPVMYQEFFAALSKAVFLEAHDI